MPNSSSSQGIPLKRGTHLRRSGLILTATTAGLLALAGPPAAAQGIVSDNFDSGTLDAGWQQRNICQPFGGFVADAFPDHGNGKAFRVQRGSFNAALIGQPQSTGTGRAWIFRTNVYTDFYVAMDLAGWNNDTNQAMVLLARAKDIDQVLAPGLPPGLGTVDGYICNYDNRQHGDGPTSRRGGQFQINLVANESPTTMAAADVTLTTGKSYRQILKNDGPTLIAQLYDLEDLTRPLVTLRTNHTELTEGVSGFVTFHRNGNVHPNLSDMTVDNYYSAPSDPNADIAPAIRHPVPGTPQVVTRVPVARNANFHPVASGISFNARVFGGGQIKADATRLYLNGVDASAALAPVPADGDDLNFATAAGTLQPNTVYAARIELEDTTGTMKSTNIFWFDTFTDAYISTAPAMTIEAEDYDSYGAFVAAPIPVSGQRADGSDVNYGIGYYGQSGAEGTDFHDLRATPEAGWADYRVFDPVGTVLGNRGDIQDGTISVAGTAPHDRPNDTTRQKYAAEGLKEYHVTRTQPSEWLNYTRVFGGQDYKVYLRCGSYDSQRVRLDVASLDAVLQTNFTGLGLFNIPNHGARLNYRYQPLTAWGQPAVVHLDDTRTLRMTMLGNAGRDDLLLQLNYLLFVPSNDGMALGDDFNDGDDSAPAPGWFRYDPFSSVGITGAAEWSFPSGNTYRLKCAPSLDPGSLGPARVGSIAPVSLADFCVIADIVDWDDSIRQVAGVMARIRTPGLGTTTGYLFTHDRGTPGDPNSGDMDIVRVTGETGTALSTTGDDSIALEPGKKYRLVFTGIGSELRGRVYEHPNLTTPVVDISATDSTYTSGAAGLLVVNNAVPTYSGGADATFDNFAALSAEPVLTVNSAGGVVTLSWPAMPVRLEWTASLTAPNWMPVTANIRRIGGQYEYDVPLAGLAGFYRIAVP